MNMLLNGEVEYPVLSPQEGLRFVHVPPLELPRHWQWILKGLDAVKAKMGDLVSYTPMHIRNSLVQNQSQLHMVTDDGVPVAFTVVTIQNDPFLNVPTVLHVWILYAEHYQNRAVKFAAEQVCKFGRSLCLEKLHFLSPRGNEAVWRRCFGIQGHETMTIYEVNLFEE